MGESGIRDGPFGDGPEGSAIGPYGSICENEECVPGCASIRERRLCPAGGAPLVVACTADTECRDGVCTTPPEQDPPPSQGPCGCRATASDDVTPAWLGVLLLGLYRLARRR